MTYLLDDKYIGVSEARDLIHHALFLEIENNPVLVTGGGDSKNGGWKYHYPLFITKINMVSKATFINYRENKNAPSNHEKKNAPDN